MRRWRWQCSLNLWRVSIELSNRSGVQLQSGWEKNEGHRLARLVEDFVLRELPQISEVLVHVEPEEELAVTGMAQVK